MTTPTGTFCATPVAIHRDGPVLRLSLARPRQHNALNTALLRSLLAALERRDARDQVLVLEGGDTVFSVGSDLRELAGMSAAAAERYSLLAHRVVSALEAWPGMTVALLRGYTLGAGLELALTCDLIAGHPQARIGMPGLAWALMPVMGGLRRLSLRCSPHLARRIFLGGHTLTGAEAGEEHLIHRLCANEAAFAAVIEEAGEWSPGAVLAIRELRLRELAGLDPACGARTFAAGFRNGECQRRISDLIAE
jgi:enoyl-CoA hydratase/carnithine racemase